MNHPILHGLTLLVVEDEPLIAMDIAMAFEKCGAHITSTNTLKHAVLLVECDGLSGAILDHALPDGDSSILCTRLRERGVPFMIYLTGATRVSWASSGCALVALQRRSPNSFVHRMKMGPQGAEKKASRE